MTLKTYLSPMTAEQRQEFASRCGTSAGHLQNIMYLCKPCHPTLASRIETESGGTVTRKSLCPDIWRMTWPELAKGKAKEPA